MADPKEVSQSEFRQHLRQADRYLAEGQFEEARNELALAKKLDPRNPFIHAFSERIAVFEAKAKSDSAEPGREGPPSHEPAGQPSGAAPGVPTPPPNPPGDVEVEEDYRRRYTDEVRKAEERTEQLLAEEKARLEKAFLTQRLEQEREFERVKLQLERDHQERMAAEIQKTEMRLEGEYQSELARLEGDLRTKLHQQFQADMVEEKERLKHELRGLADKERHSAAEMEQSLRTEYDKRVTADLARHEAELRQQLQEEHRREEEKLKIELTAEFEERMGYERGKIAEEFEKQKKRGEDVHRIELQKSRQMQEEMESKLRDDFNRKLLESVRKAEAGYEEQAKARMKEEEDKLRVKLESDFRAELEGERKNLRQEYEKLKASLEQSSQAETARLREQGEAKLSEQVTAAKRQLDEELEKKAAALRNELETRYQTEYEANLRRERENAKKEAEARIAAEKARMDAQHAAKLKEQDDQLKAVRKELRAQLEAEMVKRMEALAAEYEAKLDLLGVRIPETKAEQISFYRDAMFARYAKGELDVEDAKKLLQLKEMLDLSFDEHLAVETEARLKTYSDRIRQLVVSGSLDPSDQKTLGRLKEKYGLTEEEAKALEHHLLASFGKLRNKGRILVADDDRLLLKTVEDILSAAGYAVVTAEDIDSALEHLKATPFDLILSDIKFSDNEFEGFAFFKKVQGIPHLTGVPFVFMSALSDGVIVRSGVQLGVDDYLTKPVEPELLTAVVEGKLKRFRAMKFQ